MGRQYISILSFCELNKVFWTQNIVCHGGFFFWNSSDIFENHRNISKSIFRHGKNIFCPILPVCDNTRLSNELLWSSEIGPFERGRNQNWQNFSKSMDFPYEEYKKKPKRRISRTQKPLRDTMKTHGRKATKGKTARISVLVRSSWARILVQTKEYWSVPPPQNVAAEISKLQLLLVSENASTLYFASLIWVKRLRNFSLKTVSLEVAQGKADRLKRLVCFHSGREECFPTKFRKVSVDRNNCYWQKWLCSVFCLTTP